MNYIPSQFVIYKNQENLYFFDKLKQQATTKTTTTKPYPTKWGRLHRSNYAIMFYYKPYLDPTH